ncbi:hypothetical protein ENUP19_0018G0053 [Entamoeba nuttalli]|uniref:Glucosidase II subunit alpha n=2 Tax=Entamoeba nuttalli TaxID=412467 RepID=K2H4V6_ENTNP|nr:glycosyl hydrolase, family 31 protein [Entamoeba nuttalli P19]EKE42573.1 glycosyl hydrolase, family 31 protein [Entamoeba nuttalli P19]|eukprot:XP_008855090.1 glycosyl hydrolase, family 31 protein [Entamoeba nuttalli P19]
MHLVSILFFIVLVFAVNHDNFRTCQQTAFCRRAQNTKQQFVVNGIIEQTSTSITLDIRNPIENTSFEMRVNGIANGIFRSRMIHVGGGVKFDRYEPEIGLVLTEEGIKEVPIIVEKQKDGVVLINGQSELSIDFTSLIMKLKVNGLVVLVANDNQSLRFETGIKTIKGEEVDGAGEEKFAQFTDKKPHGPAGVSMGYSFPLAKKFFGIPEHATDVVLKSTGSDGYNEPYRLYNSDVFEFELDSPMTLYGSVPVIYSISQNAAGVFHNNPTETYVYVDGQNVRFVSESGVLDEFFLPGPKPINLIQEYLQLTGTAPMVPKYSLGYHQCRWNYMSQNEANEVIEKMDEASIPFDVLWLDIEHTDDKRYFTWKQNKFPTPNELIDKLKSTERRLVTIVDPHIKRDNNYYVYKEALDANYLVKRSDIEINYEGWCWPGNSVYIDFINPKAREWWVQLYSFEKYQYSSPYVMIWIDMNEPSVFNGPEVTMPKDNIHTDGNKTYEHRDVHNIYGLIYHMSTYNGLLKRTNGVDRPFVLSRSFYAGSQKFGAVWTGDTDSTWGHLKTSVAMTLNLNLVGILQSGGDVGGFFHDTEEELLIRWYQVGTFYPFFRAHAHLETKRREPYLFEGESKRRMKEAIEMKYLLIDYWYKEYFMSVRNKEPLLKPLFLMYPEDEMTYNIDNEFMAGNDIIVTGVFEKGATTVNQYVPKGIWYDWFTNIPVKNGLRTVPVTLDSIPIIVRGGSIIPLKERKRRASELMKYDPITLVIYADEKGEAEGYLYTDDGLTTKHNHVLSKVYLNSKGISCEVIENENGSSIPSSKEIIKIVVIGSVKPKFMFNGNNKVNFDKYRTKQLNEKGFVIRKPSVTMDSNWTISFSK